MRIEPLDDAEYLLLTTTKRDGTPAPTAVNTGGELGASSESSVALFAAAAGLFALAGGAMVLRHRTVEA